MEKIGLTSCSLYKTLSADTTEIPQPWYQQPIQVHPQIRAMFLNSKGPQRHKATMPTGDLAEFYFENIICDDEERLAIFTRTMGQSLNPQWFRDRKNRVSASKSRQGSYLNRTLVVEFEKNIVLFDMMCTDNFIDKFVLSFSYSWPFLARWRLWRITFFVLHLTPRISVMDVKRSLRPRMLTANCTVRSYGVSTPYINDVS